MPHEYYADSLTTETYETVIDAFFAAFGKTTTYKDAAEAWLDYQFLPNPTDLSITDADRMLPMLAQKRLIGVCDNGAEDVRIFCRRRAWLLRGHHHRRRRVLALHHQAAHPSVLVEGRARRLPPGRRRSRPRPQPRLHDEHRQPAGAQQSDLPVQGLRPPGSPHPGRRYHPHEPVRWHRHRDFLRHGDGGVRQQGRHGLAQVAACRSRLGPSSATPKAATFRRTSPTR